MSQAMAKAAEMYGSLVRNPLVSVWLGELVRQAGYIKSQPIKSHGQSKKTCSKAACLNKETAFNLFGIVYTERF